MRSIISTTLATALLSGSASAMNAIGIKGQDFVDGTTGDRFQLIGVDYQPGGSAGYDPSSGKDALSNPDICRRDAAIMQRIGANTLRVYNLDPDINHDQCASIFNAAGIYMVLDVNSPLPNESINDQDPASSYNAAYLNRTFALMDNFRGYPNTLAFFSANELIHDANSEQNNPPYVRAVTRDLHQYMRARGGRVVPIGYSAADVRDILTSTTNYISCAISGESNNESKSDFIGVNGYSWCGNTTDFVAGQYSQLADIYSNTSIPVFFSEYGCNVPEPREFNEVSAIYDPQLMPTFSGGLVYEYTQEDNDYGLVEVTDDDTVALLDDYATLAGKFAALDPATLSAQNQTAAAISPPACAAGLIASPGFADNWTLPAQPSGVADIIKNGVGGIQGKLVSVDLALPTALKVTWKGNGSAVADLQLIQKSSGDGLGDTTSGSAPGGAGATGGASSSSSKAAGWKAGPAGPAEGVLVGALMYLMSWL